MALRDLLAAIEEDGAAEHEQAQAESNRLAVQIISDARAQAMDICAEAVATAEAAARQEAQSMLAEARRAARLAIRDARDAALEAVLSRAREQLHELPGTPAGEVSARACLDEALVALPRASSVHVHPADVEALSTGTALELVADLGGGGAVLEDEQGRYVDNTYATRLANTWPELRARLSRSWDQAS